MVKASLRRVVPKRANNHLVEPKICQIIKIMKTVMMIDGMDLITLIGSLRKKIDLKFMKKVKLIQTLDKIVIKNSNLITLKGKKLAR